MAFTLPDEHNSDLSTLEMTDFVPEDESGTLVSVGVVNKHTFVARYSRNVGISRFSMIIVNRT